MKTKSALVIAFLAIAMQSAPQTSVNVDTVFKGKVSTTAKTFLSSQLGVTGGCTISPYVLNPSCSDPGSANAGLINAAWSGASATNPVVILLDQGIALSAHIQCPTGGFCAIQGITPGAGIFMEAGATDSAITNGYANNLNNAAPPGGLASGTYTSGITATGSVTQTCTLTSFNNVSPGWIPATATVALTGTNTIAGGTALTITFPGNFTSAPTTVVASNGTATCSGTATISTTVTPGATGSNIVIRDLSINMNAPNIAAGNGCSNGTANCTGIHIANTDGLWIDNVRIFNTPSYGILYDRDINVHTAGTWISVPSGSGRDCRHMDGPEKDVFFSRNYCGMAGTTASTTDTDIALNAPEGHCGPIDNVNIESEEVGNVFSAVAGYNSAGSCAFPLTNIRINGVTVDAGSVVTQALVYMASGNGLTAADSNGPIFVSDAHSVQAPVYQSVGSWNTISVVNSDCTNELTSNPLAPSCVNVQNTISNLIVKNVGLYRNTSAAGSSGAFLLQTINPVTNLQVDGWVSDNGSFSATPYLVDAQGSVSSMAITAPVNVNGKISVPLSSAGLSHVTSIAGIENFYNPPTTISGLPACSSVLERMVGLVTNASSPAYLAAPSTTGSVHAPVRCLGGSWVYN